MVESGFAELLGAGQSFLDAAMDALTLAYGWAKEWQPLLAGLLVVFAAFIFASATLKAARIRAAAILQTGAASPDRASDLRMAAGPAGRPPPAGKLTGTLEQLRSLIRSAMSSLTFAAEKENSPAHFLCQRIAHLPLERCPPPDDATVAARELYIRLLEQLESLRLNLKKEAPVTENSDILLQLNTTARNLMAALANRTRRQA
jgi:hypothetical protein